MVINVILLAVGSVVGLFGLFFTFNPSMFVGYPLDERPTTFVAKVLWKLSYSLRCKVASLFGFVMLLGAFACFFFVIGPSPKELYADYRFKAQKDYSYGSTVKGSLVQGGGLQTEVIDGYHSLQLYYLDLESVQALEVIFDNAFIKEINPNTASADLQQEIKKLLTSNEIYFLSDLYEINKIDINSKLVLEVRPKPKAELADWHLKRAQDFWRQRNLDTSIAHARQAFWVRSHYYERGSPQLKEVEAMISSATQQKKKLMSQMATSSTPPVNN